MRVLLLWRPLESIISSPTLVTRLGHPAKLSSSTNSWIWQRKPFLNSSVRRYTPIQLGKPEPPSETPNPKDDIQARRTADDSLGISSASVEDVKETFSKLQMRVEEHLTQSSASSVEERLLEINNRKGSPAATAKRRPKEFDPIVTSLDHYDLLPGAPWGFVLFRTVYGPSSDTSFAQLLGYLRDLKETLSYHDQEYLIAHHELTVVEDEKSLSGADSHTVREAFRAWVANDLTPRLKDPERWGGQAEIRRILRSDIPVGDPFWKADSYHPATCMPTRWQFCLFVDECCLRSLNESTGSPGPHAKILTSDWKGRRSVAIPEGWEDGETDDPTEDVGWMYMDVQEHVETYRDLMESYAWWEQPMYERPFKGFIP